MSGTYKIWVSAHMSGAPQVGASYNDRPDTVAWEHIFPSQMEYRVTARNQEGEVEICTATYARNQGWEILYSFPRANGELGRRGSGRYM